MSCKISGRLVTMPVPLGRLRGSCQMRRTNLSCTSYKSLPTIFSKTELFPLDCDPTTAIWGKSIGFWTCGDGIVSYLRGNSERVLEAGRYTYTDCCEHIL